MKYILDEKERDEYQKLKKEKEQRENAVNYLKLAVEDLLTFGLYNFQGSIEELIYHEGYHTEEEALKRLEEKKQNILHNIRTIFYSKNFVVQKNIRLSNQLIITNKNTKEIIYI